MRIKHYLTEANIIDMYRKTAKALQNTVDVDVTYTYKDLDRLIRMRLARCGLTVSERQKTGGSGIIVEVVKVDKDVLLQFICDEKTKDYIKGVAITFDEKVDKDVMKKMNGVLIGNKVGLFEPTNIKQKLSNGKTIQIFDFIPSKKV